MASVGNRLAWTDKPIVDQHCVGGIPGNRTSMIVVPIIAAHGLDHPQDVVPRDHFAGRNGGHDGGLARVEIDIDEMRDIVGRTKGCIIVWGGHVNLAPADDILISVERPLGIDTPSSLVASILAKKISAGSTHLVVDIPTGPTANSHHADAIRIRKLFEYVSDQLGLTLNVEITDGAAGRIPRSPC